MDDKQLEQTYIDKQNAKWYVLHTYSGYENVAKENLEQMVVNHNLTDRIFESVIPMEDVIEEKNGKKKLVQRKTMPGYLLVKMIYGDDIWHNITRTRGVTGFTGPGGRPLALSDEEVQRLRLERVTVEMDLEIGDKVEIIDGPLNTMIGTVKEIDAENSRAKIAVEMFGRETLVELDYTQIRRLAD